MIALFATNPSGHNLAYLDTVNAEALRVSCGETDLKDCEIKLLPLRKPSRTRPVTPSPASLALHAQSLQATLPAADLLGPLL